MGSTNRQNRRRRSMKKRRRADAERMKRDRDPEGELVRGDQLLDRLWSRTSTRNADERGDDQQ